MNSNLLNRLTEFRRSLHRQPEVSGEEEHTSQIVVEFLKTFGPKKILRNLGGFGVAAVFDSEKPGPEVMVRCELDALPIQEKSELSYRSVVDGVAHLCGHDGHMAMVAALADRLTKQPVKNGKVILLFQPAEEIGTGAKAVCNDLSLHGLKPDFSYSLHNMPGMPMGSVAVKDGVFNCASVGVCIEVSGKTAHASNPEQGVSPVGLVADLVTSIRKKNDLLGKLDTFQNITIVHLNVGEAAFGVAPGDGKLMATLRSDSDSGLENLRGWILELLPGLAKSHGLEHQIEWHDHFPACINHPEAVEVIERCLNAARVEQIEMKEPMRPSEDFGQYAQFGPSAMFLLGSGENQPGLHNPDYDFPDELIPIGADIFGRILEFHFSS